VSNSTGREASFWQRSNDLANRSLTARLVRFLRAHAFQLCAKASALAQEPRLLAAWRHGWDNDHYPRLLHWRDEGFRPSVVYDIGAHAGGWAEMCQAIYQPMTCCLFEPQNEYLEQARKRQPHAANWIFLPIALGEVEREETLRLTKNRTASSLLPPLQNDWLQAGTTEIGQEQVRVLPLDELAHREKLPLPDLVKIDVQGFEAKVIAGGTSTLRGAQRIVVEVSLKSIYRGQPLLPEVLFTLTQCGFRLTDFSDACRSWPNDELWQVDLWFKRLL
jgi:FkbM family methyltransferase